MLCADRWCIGVINWGYLLRYTTQKYFCKIHRHSLKHSQSPWPMNPSWGISKGISQYCQSEYFILTSCCSFHKTLYLLNPCTQNFVFVDKLKHKIRNRKLWFMFLYWNWDTKHKTNWFSDFQITEHWNSNLKFVFRFSL